MVRALESGQLAGYAGDVWYPHPPPVDHPWRTMPHEGMTPHISGTSLSAQARYAAGNAGDPRVLPRRPTDTRGVPHRRRRSSGRCRRSRLHGRNSQPGMTSLPRRLEAGGRASELSHPSRALGPATSAGCAVDVLPAPPLATRADRSRCGRIWAVFRETTFVSPRARGPEVEPAGQNVSNSVSNGNGFR